MKRISGIQDVDIAESAKATEIKRDRDYASARRCPRSNSPSSSRFPPPIVAQGDYSCDYPECGAAPFQIQYLLKWIYLDKQLQWQRVLKVNVASFVPVSCLHVIH